MEQFNPGLRNLINLGKNYEKAVNGKCLFSKFINIEGVQLLIKYFT